MENKFKIFLDEEKKEILRELKGFACSEQPAPKEDWDLIWVLSGPSLNFDQAPEKGKRNETRDRVETGLSIARRVTALRLGKKTEDVINQDIIENGPDIYFNGVEVQNAAFKKEISSNWDFPLEKVIVSKNPGIKHTGDQFDEIPINLLAGRKKIVIVSSLYHLPRVKRYVQKHSDKMNPEKVILYPAEPKNASARAALAEIKKIPEYKKRGILPGKKIEFMNNHAFKIGNRKIGPGNPVFIIAEISANHNQSFAKAKKLVETACKIGVDAVKMQTYTPDTLTIDCSNKWFQVNVNPDWKGKTLYELYKITHMPWSWQPKLKKIADKYGVILFSTAYDETAVDFLEKMKVPVYKIASFEIGDIELLEKVAKTGKPVIISRGMASIKEIKKAIKTLKKNGASKIAVLHCVSSYPARPEDMNLATIPDIRKKFGVVAGLSDHSLGIGVSVASVALGACIIEKHFTLKRSEGGADAAFSLEPEELKQLVRSIREAEGSLGSVKYGASKRESENIIFKRSLFAVEDIKAGGIFTKKNIRCIRPGYGLEPVYLKKVLGKIARRDIKRGTPLSLTMIKNNTRKS